MLVLLLFISAASITLLLLLYLIFGVDRFHLLIPVELRVDLVMLETRTSFEKFGFVNVVLVVKVWLG